MAQTSASEFGDNPPRPAPDLSVIAVDAVVSMLPRPVRPQAPGVWEVLTRPVPFLRRVDRTLLRGIMLAARRQIGTVSGIEHIVTPHPFIVALNHTTRREALLVPAMMIFRRGGRRIHFLSDWMFGMMPGVGFLFRRAGTIAVMNKPARPRALNAAKPFFLEPVSALERARALLRKGNPVGIFPEGTVNRAPERLLPGRYGAARLSLETGVPIVPVGIRYPQAPATGPVPENAAMDVHIGAPMTPPEIAGPTATPAEVRAWHAVMMTEIARLSGRKWSPPVASR